MNCPRCSSNMYVKAGKVNSKQRYKCKKCNYHYSVAMKSTAKPTSVKKFALQLYLEGLGFRSIGRILNVSNVSVLNWIKSYGNEVASLRNDDSEIDFVELDEMHSYIGNKKTSVGFGLLLIDLESDSLTSLLATGAPRRQKIYGD